MMEPLSNQLGEEPPNVSFDTLPQVLGKGMPDLKLNPIGRLRLVRALQQRFGDGYRGVRGVNQTLQEFDDKMDFEVAVKKMGNIRAKNIGE